MIVSIVRCYICLFVYIICSHTLLIFFADKQMDEKELSDPLNNVSVIKGNPALLFFSENIDRIEVLALFCSSWLLPDTAYLTNVEREKSMSHA